MLLIVDLVSVSAGQGGFLSPFFIESLSCPRLRPIKAPYLNFIFDPRKHLASALKQSMLNATHESISNANWPQGSETFRRCGRPRGHDCQDRERRDQGHYPG